MSAQHLSLHSVDKEKIPDRERMKHQMPKVWTMNRQWFHVHFLWKKNTKCLLSLVKTKFSKWIHLVNAPEHQDRNHKRSLKVFQVEEKPNTL